MQHVSIRDLMHNFSRYLKGVKEGECITVLERRKPVADIIPHNPNVMYPGWKRSVSRRKIGGESFSTSVSKSREND